MSKRAHKRASGFLTGLILAGLGMMGAAVSTASAQGQFGKEPAVPSRNVGTKYTNKRGFKLPVSHLTPAERSKLRALCLYCKTRNSDWTQVAKIDPMDDHFIYRAQEDGEFWFIVASIDAAGRIFPPPEEMRFAQLVVVIDTHRPTIQVDDFKPGPQGSVWRCSMQAQYPNPESLRIICRNSQGERPIEPMAGQPGVFLTTKEDGIPQRIIGCDRCNNTAELPLNLEKPASAASPAPNAGRTEPGDPWRSKQADGQITVNASPQQGSPPFLGADVKPDNPNDTNRPAFNVNMVNPGAGRDNGNSSQIAIPLPAVNPMPMPIQAPVAEFSQAGSQAPSLGQASSGNRTVLSTTQAFVEYRVDQLGSSGIGKVQVYFTGDQGQSWALLKEDYTKRSPVEVKLPGEGVFGINVVMTNGYGFGGTPPHSGEAPSCWIEVDTTRPIVQLQPVEILPDATGLEIRWTAHDKNLATEPITLSYRTSPGAPWQPIVRALKNDGHYRWAFPRNVGSEFYFKIDAVDQVGNVGSSETPTALTLDMTVPHATVIRVTGFKN